MLNVRRIGALMPEPGQAVDHPAIHWWAITLLPMFAAICYRNRRCFGKRKVHQTDIQAAYLSMYLNKLV